MVGRFWGRGGGMVDFFLGGALCLKLIRRECNRCEVGFGGTERGLACG